MTFENAQVGPVFPLAGTIDRQRQRAKDLIDRADPVTVQITLALLSQIRKQRKLKADYLAMLQEEREQ